jgi:hypothetical protein
MLLILEIILAISAWRRGWRAWALMPFAVTWGLAFFIGVAMGVSGASPEEAVPVGLVLELGCLVALAVMCGTARKPAEASASEVGTEAAAPAGLQAVPMEAENALAVPAEVAEQARAA